MLRLLGKGSINPVIPTCNSTIQYKPKNGFKKLKFMIAISWLKDREACKWKKYWNDLTVRVM